MKAILSFVAIIFATIFNAQTCAFDQVQMELETQNPQIKKNREASEAQLLKMDLQSYLNSKGATSKNGMYAGTIYEIPIVVHVITSSSGTNSGLTLTDAQITTWINNCNKMYATTYGNGYYPEGTGSLDGNVIPFKMVLAKRSPSCTTSTGIMRYDGSTITGYDQYGVQRSGTNGATTTQIKTLAPHWPENAYFNIYVVLGFDGDKSTYGLMGWCGYPTNPDYAYESFMKVTVVTNNNDSTLAHEFGHGMGLAHIFDGANAQPGNNPTAADCPANADCTVDNDKVCDTEPTASLLSVNPTPTNSATNPCTGTNYKGAQYNVMNYTYSPRKFTAGQRDRATAVFLLNRENLTKSLGGTSLVTNPSIGGLTNANCNPPGITNSGNYGMGPTKVVLGSINNASETYNTTNLQYYKDYSTQNCLSSVVYTDIPATASSDLKVSIGGSNPQYLKAWIDYNNNGIFEAGELIGTSGTRVAVASSPYTITFTPPGSAVKNTYLRMRVLADYNDTAVCGTLAYGQIEDYSVRITTTLATTGNVIDNSDLIYYSKTENKISLSNRNNQGFGNYEIYDLSGLLIQKGNAKDEVLLKQRLPKGTYIINYQNKSKKFKN